MFTGVRKQQTKIELNIDWKHFLLKVYLYLCMIGLDVGCNVGGRRYDAWCCRRRCAFRCVSRDRLGFMTALILWESHQEQQY